MMVLKAHRWPLQAKQIALRHAHSSRSYHASRDAPQPQSDACNVQTKFSRRWSQGGFDRHRRLGSTAINQVGREERCRTLSVRAI